MNVCENCKFYSPFSKIEKEFFPDVSGNGYTGYCYLDGLFVVDCNTCTFFVEDGD